jgi:hypothetical protein
MKRTSSKSEAVHATGQAADEALRLAHTVRVIDQRRAGGQRIATASPPGFRLVRQGRPHEWTVAGARTSRLLYVDRARILRRGDEIALAAERQVSIETTQRRTVPDDQWAESAHGRRVELPSGVGYLFSKRRPGGHVPAPGPGDGGPAPGSLTAIVLRPRPDCLIVLQGRGLTDAQLLDLGGLAAAGLAHGMVRDRVVGFHGDWATKASSTRMRPLVACSTATPSAMCRIDSTSPTSVEQIPELLVIAHHGPSSVAGPGAAMPGWRPPAPRAPDRCPPPVDADWVDTSAKESSG